MTFLRNLGRLLRNDGRALDREPLVLALGATLTALGGCTFAITNSAPWALAAVLLGIPLQLAALAAKPTAMALAALGTALGATAVALGVRFAAQLFLVPNFPLGAWSLGLVVGCLAGVVIARSFIATIRTLNEPDPY